MSRRASPALFSVGVTVLVLVLIFGAAASFIASRAEWARSTLDSIEPRHARLLGLRDSADRLTAAAQQSGARVRALAQPADLPTDRVGAELQQRVRADAAAAGFAVVGSQILPVNEHPGFEAVPVTVIVEGALEHLADFLDRLDGRTPAIKVQSVSVTPMRGRNVAADRYLRVEITLAVARLTP